MVKIFLEHFVKNSCRRQARQNSGLKKKQKGRKKKKKMTDCMSNERAMIIRWLTGLTWKISIRMSQYFHDPCERFSGSVKVKLVLSNYVKKADLKGATSTGTSALASKTNLAK